MPDIHIQRAHQLGLDKARRVASRWVEEAEKRLGVDCTREEGPEGDLIEFSRSGVKGEFRIEADRFTLDARLGLLLGAFKGTIESEIESNLDALLAAEAPSPSQER